MPDQYALVQSAMVLREQNAQTWDNFVNAVRQYSAEVAMEMVRAEPRLLKRAQGMSIQANEFAVMLVKAPELWAKFQEQRALQARKAGAR